MSKKQADRYVVEVFRKEVLSASENKHYGFFTAEGFRVDDLDVTATTAHQCKRLDSVSYLKNLINKGGRKCLR
jgi:hypothetical protein